MIFSLGLSISKQISPPLFAAFLCRMDNLVYPCGSYPVSTGESGERFLLDCRWGA